MIRAPFLLSVTLSLALPVLIVQGEEPAADQAATPQPRIVRLTAADARQKAAEARAQVKVEMPEGLELSLWAPEELLVDPVALDMDAQGRAWVASSTRNDLPLDIRGHQNWMTVTHRLTTTEALRAFYAREMAAERSAENTWIEDLNGDGVRDIRDLAEMKERLYRIEDTDADGIADLSYTAYEGFNDDPTFDIAGGVLYEPDGSVVVGVPPGVYRLRDSNGDGTLDTRTTISEGWNVHPTFGGHGVSGVMMGPDGRLYWEVGDMGMNVVDRSGRRWAYPNQGVVARSEPDGSGFEVFATGIRNLQEFAFDEHGNLISVDNDGDHQGESERLVYLPYGSDSGWRTTWQYGKYTDPLNNRYNVWMDEEAFKPRHPGQASHILPPVALWHAGPSGMAYNPGTALSPAWRRHFFVSSFPGSPANARIYAFTLKEEGAGFVMDRETTLLRGVLTVGMRIGADGALYITDWITGWDSKERGRLWKLDTPATSGSVERREVQALLREDLSRRATADVARLLHHADMRVRQKAQFDLVRRADVDTLVTAARQNDDALARLHGLWGLGQLARRQPQTATELLPFLADPTAEVRAQAAKMLGDVRHAPAAGVLIERLEDPAPRVRFFAAEALGRLAHRPAANAIVAMLAANRGTDVYLQHAGMVALGSVADPIALEALSSHPSPDVRTAGLTALRRLRHAGVARFLGDRDAAVVLNAARAINDDGSIPEAVPALAAMLSRGDVTGEPLLRRIINANLRIGSNEALARVAAFAGDGRQPEDVRVEAVATLGVWAAPSPLDRVDGSYLDPYQVPVDGQRAARDVASARSALLRLVDATLGAGAPPASEAMKIALADAAGRLNATSAGPALVAVLEQDTAASVRLAALRALQTLRTGDMNALMATALADTDDRVRAAALTSLPDLPMSDAARVDHIRSVMAGGQRVEQQSAIEVLGRLDTDASRAFLASLMNDLDAGRLAPELHVDVLSAIQADGAASLVARLEAYRMARKADSLPAAFRDGLAVGGDARRGLQVFTRNPLAECTRCHTVGATGSDVGPNLTKIGGVLTRGQLVEALIDPNARIAPGYAVEQASPVSAMPPLGLLLDPKDVRDLVAYLASLR